MVRVSLMSQWLMLSLLQRGFLLCSKLISWLVENFSFADGPLYDFTAYTEVNIYIWWLILLIVSSSIVRLICTMLFGCSVKSCQSSHSTMEDCSKISFQKISVALPTSRLVSIHQLSYCTISHRAPSTVSLVRILMSPWIFTCLCTSQGTAINMLMLSPGQSLIQCPCKGE